MSKLKQFIFCLIVSMVSFSNLMSQEIPKPVPAFDFISKYPKVRDFTMNSANDEAYFTIQSPLGDLSVIAVIKNKNGKWQKPKMVKFSGKYLDLEPFLSPDGLKLYFVSNRPLDNSANKKKKDFDIWYVTRKTHKSSWSKPVNIGSPINTKGDEFYPAVAKNGNLYFTLVSPKSKGLDDIFFSEWKNNSYSEPVSLSEAINSKGAEYNSYIAPDESFIIFGGWRRKDSLGSGDMYISFRNKNGVWGKAKNLGKGINSRFMEFCPFVDLKSKTLYFTSRRSRLKLREFKSLKDFERDSNQYENGLSRIYKVSIANILENR